jgi:hypothetical protein
MMTSSKILGFAVVRQVETLTRARLAPGHSHLGVYVVQRIEMANMNKYLLTILSDLVAHVLVRVLRMPGNNLVGSGP